MDRVPDEIMLTWVLKPNMLGRTAMSSCVSWRSHELYCNLRVALDTARLRLLSRVFEIRTGAPPVSIQDLVPDYINAVPVNWVTGETITLDTVSHTENEVTDAKRR